MSKHEQRVEVVFGTDLGGSLPTQLRLEWTEKARAHVREALGGVAVDGRSSLERSAVLVNGKADAPLLAGLRDLFAAYIRRKRAVQEQLDVLIMRGGAIMRLLDLQNTGTFLDLLNAADAHGYTPTMRADVDEKYGQLADVYDAAQLLRGSKARAYRGGT